MAKKKVAKAKPKKKASKAKSFPGKVFDDPHRIDEIIQRVRVIYSRLDEIIKTGRAINVIMDYQFLLDSNSREYFIKNRKDLQEIWEAARHDYFLNLEREKKFKDAQNKAEEDDDHIPGFRHL